MSTGTFSSFRSFAVDPTAGMLVPFHEDWPSGKNPTTPFCFLMIWTIQLMVSMSGIALDLGIEPTSLSSRKRMSGLRMLPSAAIQWMGRGTKAFIMKGSRIIAWLPTTTKGGSRFRTRSSPVASVP